MYKLWFSAGWYGLERQKIEAFMCGYNQKMSVTGSGIPSMAAEERFWKIKFMEVGGNK